MGAAHRRRGGIVEATDGIDVVLDPVAGKWLDQHECAVLRQGACRVPDRIDRAAHVMQAVEEADQIVVAPGVGVGFRDLEIHPILNTGVARDLVGRCNRCLMNVESPEPALGECLGHQHGRMTMPSSDIGHLGAGRQLFGDAGQRRQPVLDEARAISVPVERGNTAEESLVVLAPAHAPARLEGGPGPP